MSFSKRLAAITPADFKPTAEALGLLMGYSGDEFRVSLSSDGGASVTHLALSAAVTPQNAEIWDGTVTPVVEGYTPEQIEAIRSQLYIAVDDGDSVKPFEQLQALAAQHGLIFYEGADDE